MKQFIIKGPRRNVDQTVIEIQGIMIDIIFKKERQEEHERREKQRIERELNLEEQMQTFD